MPACSLIWFRTDLRLDDHPALCAAVATGRPVVAVYVLDEAAEGRPLGAAARWWLHHSLENLAARLAAHGVSLILKRGAAEQVLPALAQALSAQTVHWNSGPTPFGRAQEQRVAARLGPLARPACSDLLAEPETLLSGSGRPYRVFTPFWKALFARGPSAAPLAPPPHITGITAEGGEDLAAWHLRPRRPDWAGGLRQTWHPGEEAAEQRLAAFLAQAITAYPTARDLPAVDGTSRLSPHLRFGELSPRRLWDVASRLAGDRATAFLREVGWLEFNRHLLFQAPTLAEDPIRPEFAHFPWREDHEAFQRWCRGETGFPLVDAGMRQLWDTGWMHNRVRMCAASFLIKDLLIPWQWGERWFWETLVDADPANNPANWQWVAGCGADAAPFFRIFNPTTQQGKFDPDGAYVRRWGPLLSSPPLVDHATARLRALAALETMKERSAP